MKLSMSLLADYLMEYAPECHILEDTATIKGVRMFSEQQPSYSLEYVYLGEAKGYIKDPRYDNAILLASGQNQIFCRGVEYEEMLNKVLSAFEYYGRVEQKFLLLSATHESLTEIMKAAETVLDDSVFVFDIDGKLLGAANQGKLEEETLLNTMQNGEMLGRQVVGNVFLTREGIVSHDLTDAPQHLRRMGSTDEGTVAMYLMQNEERVGFIMIFPRDRLHSDVALTLEPYLAAACSQAAEFTEKSSVMQGNHSIFLRLLQQESMPQPVIRKFEMSLGFRDNPVLLLIHSISIRNHTFRHLFINYVENSEIPGISCEFNNDVVILAEESRTQDLLLNIEKNVSASAFAIGISMPVQYMEQMHTAYQQALFALNREPGAGVRCCREYALDYMISVLCDKDMAWKLLHPALALLEEYDRENHTEFYRTLKVYVQTGQNQTKTAKALFVHLNTLKYRIRRICEMCHLDFQNEEDIFYLLLSYKMRGNQERSQE